jgi:hypothetical protein
MSSKKLKMEHLRPKEKIRLLEILPMVKVGMLLKELGKI